MQPKISIIVPVYNVEAYLPACLSSCINQTMEEIEIICVNDGSTDNSKRVLRKFARNDRRIKVIHKKNGGLSSARNAGLDYFRGEVVMFLDSDDYLAPNACERVWTEMQKQPTDILIFGTQIFPAIPKAPDWYSRTLNVTDHRYTKPGAEVLFTEHCSKPFVWRQAFSGRILKKKNVRFYPEITYGEDIAFQMIIFPYAKNFSFISDKLYYYRWYRENSLMRQPDRNLETTLCAHLKFAWLITEYWQQQGWLPTWGMKYTRWLLQFFVPNCTHPSVENSQKYMQILADIFTTFSLGVYLDEMTANNKILADKVRKYM